MFLLAGGPVAWASRKQRSVATSTTEAEYVGLSIGAKQLLWLMQLLRELGFPSMIGRDAFCGDLRGDNTGAIALVENGHLHERTKHIDIAYHHVRDLRKRNLIKVSYVPTDQMAADGLTKVLDKVKHARFKQLLGLQDSGSQSRQDNKV